MTASQDWIEKTRRSISKTLGHLNNMNAHIKPLEEANAGLRKLADVYGEIATNARDVLEKIESDWLKSQTVVGKGVRVGGKLTLKTPYR